MACKVKIAESCNCWIVVDLWHMDDKCLKIGVGNGNGGLVVVVVGVEFTSVEPVVRY